MSTKQGIYLYTHFVLSTLLGSLVFFVIVFFTIAGAYWGLFAGEFAQVFFGMPDAIFFSSLSAGASILYIVVSMIIFVFFPTHTKPEQVRISLAKNDPVTKFLNIFLGLDYKDIP